MFAENKPVKRHDDTQLGMLESQLVCIDAINEIPKDIVSLSQINANKLIKITESGNLASQLKLKISAQAMLTLNLDIEDRLVNGPAGTAAQFKENQTISIY